MEDFASTASFDAFAKDATYTPTGVDPVALSVRVIIDRGVERWGEGRGGATVIESRDEASLLRSAVYPSRGANLVVGADTYTIGEIVEDDGIIVVVTIKAT